MSRRNQRRNPNAPYWIMMEEAERRILRGALAQGVTVEGAARMLGIAAATFLRRVYEIGDVGLSEKKMEAARSDYARRKAYALKRFQRAGLVPAPADPPDPPEAA